MACVRVRCEVPTVDGGRNNPFIEAGLAHVASSSERTLGGMAKRPAAATQPDALWPPTA